MRKQEVITIVTYFDGGLWKSVQEELVAGGKLQPMGFIYKKILLVLT